MARVIFAWLFIVLIFFYYSNSLLHQLQQPVIKFPNSDNSFWLLYLTRLPQLLINYKWISVLFDVTLACCTLLAAIFPNKKIFTIISVIGVWLLYMLYCSSAGKHYAQIGYMLAPIPFLVVNQKRFDLLWNALRYWVCLLYVYVGFSKMYYGGFSYPQNMSNIIMQEHAEDLVFLKDGFWFNMYNYLITHPSVSQWLYRFASIFEMACVIGFFTKKFDKWILFALIAFHVSNLFFMSISFVEQSLIFAPFLPWHKWATKKNS